MQRSVQLTEEDVTESSANTEQAEFWSRMAPTWLEFEDQMEDVAGPPGVLAMDRLGLRPGQRVVDVGCGAGRTTLELASLVGPGGTMVGVDIAAEMLAYGRERAARDGVSGVEFLHADVQVTDLGDASFDAAYSRFGVMFFSDPVAAFANMRRALRPGGLLSFVCWQSPSENEWMLVPGAAVASVTRWRPQIPGPGEPGPYSLTDPDRVRSLLSEAGFDDVDIELRSDWIIFPEARIPDVALGSTRVGRICEGLRDVDDQTRDRALAVTGPGRPGPGIQGCPAGRLPRLKAVDLSPPVGAKTRWSVAWSNVSAVPSSAKMPLSGQGPPHQCPGLTIISAHAAAGAAMERATNTDDRRTNTRLRDFRLSISASPFSPLRSLVASVA